MRSAARRFAPVERTSLRGRIEAAIDTLIALLDEVESDPDLEPDNDDEPSFGWSEESAGRALCWTQNDEVEADPAEDGIADWDALDLLGGD
ncbi:hypothetical protein [Xanthobacter autotrophicus]|uniref:hypothetical protein n=1 Tax=Xanthobacter autotrophicus TaxID=280 RepID=UPI003729262B